MAEQNYAWMDVANEIDQETVEITGPQYPYVQWVNGKPPLKPAGGVPWTGGWFMPDQGNFVEAKGWTAGELTHDDGKATIGFFARDITVAVIRIRRRWLVYQGDQARSFAWDNYKTASDLGKATGHLQTLALIRGLEEHGVFVLTMKGTICRAFTTGGKGGTGVLSEFSRVIVAEANNLNAKRGVSAKFPYRAFWLTVGPVRDEKGNPNYTEVGQKPNSSLVTLPVALHLPEKVQPGDLEKRFVGMELLTTLNNYYREAEEWAKAWDYDGAGQPAGGNGNGNGRGVAGPAPTDETYPDEDLPF